MIDNWKNLQDNTNYVKLDSESSAFYGGSRKTEYIKCLKELPSKVASRFKVE